MHRKPCLASLWASPSHTPCACALDGCVKMNQRAIHFYLWYNNFIRCERKNGMCTALTLKTKDNYFGRNLDLDRSYGEEVVIMPRKYPLSFRKMGDMGEHYAMIGMATVVNGTPLYYEAANEHGLCMAGLNFPQNAFYHPEKEGKDNITPFEFLPWTLGQCKSLAETRVLLSKINLVNIPFSETLPLSPLHWIISDKDGSVTVESMKDGLHIHENPVGVLSNNPPFQYHMKNLENYRHLRADNRDVMLEENEGYTSYCQGLGAVGLPGDVSSMSRFVRIVFGKENSVCQNDELSSVCQFFHLLTSVAMVKGSCVTDEGTLDITGYSACINADRGLYYYTTYGNRRISCVDMQKTDLNADSIIRFPLILTQSIEYQN